jgi:hypothetical protein
MKNVQGMRRRFLVLATLIGIGIILGSICLCVINLKGITNTWEFEFENGRIILDAEDRNYLKEQALSVALEDEEIKELLAGKDYTTQVTLICNAKVENILVNHTILQSTKRFAVTNVDLMVVVTVIFEDGSGYNIPVDWQDWTVGEPEFAEQVSPPEDLIRITATNSTERTRSLP